MKQLLTRARYFTSRHEDESGYCRASAAGRYVWFSGTTPTDETGACIGPCISTVQMLDIITGIINGAAEQAGLTPNDVVHTTLFTAGGAHGGKAWNIVEQRYRNAIQLMSGVNELDDQHARLELRAFGIRGCGRRIADGRRPPRLCTGRNDRLWVRPAGVGVSFSATAEDSPGTPLGQLFGDCLVQVTRQLDRRGYSIDEVVDLVITVSSIMEWFASVASVSQGVFRVALPAATLIESWIAPIDTEPLALVRLEGVAVHCRAD